MTNIRDKKIICSFCKNKIERNGCRIYGIQLENPVKCEHFELKEENKEKIKRVVKIFQVTNIKRLLNFIIDLFFVGILNIVLIKFLIILFPRAYNIIRDNTFVIKMIQIIIFLVIFILYYTLFEGTIGKTLGKLFTGSKVIREDGNEINLGIALKRTILRLVPFEPFSFLFNQNLHDNLTNTLVVYDNFTTEQKIRKRSVWKIFMFLVFIIILKLGYDLYQKHESQIRKIKKYTTLLYKGNVINKEYINDTFGIKKFNIPKGFQVRSINMSHVIFNIQKGSSLMNFSVYYKKDYPQLTNHSEFLLYQDKKIKEIGYSEGINFKPISEGWYEFGGEHFKYLRYKIYPDTSEIFLRIVGMREDIFLEIDLIARDSIDLKEMLNSLKQSKFDGYIW